LDVLTYAEVAGVFLDEGVLCGRNWSISGVNGRGQEFEKRGGNRGEVQEDAGCRLTFAVFLVAPAFD